jgi:phage terminase large subunit-like protein
VNKEKFVNWFDGEFEGCLEEAWELWIYTKKGVNDVYRHFEEKQFYVVYKLPAILQYPSQYENIYKDVDGQPIFDKVIVRSDDYEISDPERFTIEQFLTKKFKMRPIEFESELQLNAMAATGKYWSWQNLKFIKSYADFFELVEPKRRQQKLQVIGAMDLAYGKSARADFTALAIIGMFENKYYVLDVLTKRGASVAQMAQMIGDAYRTMGKYYPMTEIYVENDFWQSEYVTKLRKKCPFVTIKPVLARQEQAQLKKEESSKRVDLDGKAVRIWTSLESLIDEHRLILNKNMRNFKEFEDEFRTFPKCSHFDVLDAISMGILKMAKKSALIYALHG